MSLRKNNLIILKIFGLILLISGISFCKSNNSFEEGKNIYNNTCIGCHSVRYNLIGKNLNEIFILYSNIGIKKEIDTNKAHKPLTEKLELRDIENLRIFVEKTMKPVE